MTGGSEVSVVWRGRRVRAWVPAPLAVRDLSLDERTTRATATAAAEAGFAAGALPDDYAPLARLLLRAEGVASSYLEGISAPAVDIVLAVDRVDGSVRSRVRNSVNRHADDAAGWVAANLAVTTDAVASAADELSVATLCAWHRRLMAGSPLPERHVGVLRVEQGWIGGTSPLDAALVTPPSDRVAGLLGDLVAFANRDDVDPVVQAAAVHAQFEVVHPFADGNGRLGRVLVSWLLTRRLALLVPPPVSLRMAADRGGYLAGLTQFRLGEHRPWISWFAGAIAGAGADQRRLIESVAELRTRWHSALEAGRRVRSDSVARATLDLLPQQVVVTAASVAQVTGCTTRAAADALRVLEERGVVTRVTAPAHGPGRPALRFVSLDLLALVGPVG